MLLLSGGTAREGVIRGKGVACARIGGPPTMLDAERIDRDGGRERWDQNVGRNRAVLFAAADDVSDVQE